MTASSPLRLTCEPSSPISAFSRILKITKNLPDFIIAVTGISIKSELAGVVHLWTYSCFESLKVRNYRLEPVPVIAFIKESVRIRSNPQPLLLLFCTSSLL